MVMCIGAEAQNKGENYIDEEDLLGLNEDQNQGP